MEYLYYHCRVYSGSLYALPMTMQKENMRCIQKNVNLSIENFTRVKDWMSKMQEDKIMR